MECLHRNQTMLNTCKGNCQTRAMLKHRVSLLPLTRTPSSDSCIMANQTEQRRHLLPKECHNPGKNWSMHAGRPHYHNEAKAIDAASIFTHIGIPTKRCIYRWANLWWHPKRQKMKSLRCLHCIGQGVPLQWRPLPVCIVWLQCSRVHMAIEPNPIKCHHSVQTNIATVFPFEVKVLEWLPEWMNLRRRKVDSAIFVMQHMGALLVEPTALCCSFCPIC